MKGKNYHVTLLSGEEEARIIHSAITVGDYETLSTLFCTLGQVRRKRLLRHYQAIFGKKLSQTLNDNLAGDYLHLCLSVISDPYMLIANEVNGILGSFPQPNEELLFAMLCERSMEELNSINEFYRKKFSKSLVSDMDEFLEPEASKWIKILIEWKEIDSCCDLQLAIKDTQSLLTLGMGRSYGLDGPVLSSLIRRRCAAHMRNVFSELRRLGNAPTDLIEQAIPQDTRKRIVYLIQCIEQPELFNARILHSVKSEAGRLWNIVLLIRLTRSKEFFRKVELHFYDVFKIRLLDDLKNDTGESTGRFMKKLLKYY